MARRQLYLISSSNVHGYGYLETSANDIKTLLNKNNVKKVLFIPYALKDYDGYLTKVSEVFNEWGFEMDGIHSTGNPVNAVNNAEAFYVGGGNTFRLLNSLYNFNLIEPIRKRVLKDGIPYISASAGTNVATKSIHTTNDMPIVYPPSFNALELVPFNINPHYQDPEPESKHKGETREERILEYQQLPESGNVLGLREGTALKVEGDRGIVTQINNCRLFIKNENPKELEVGTDISFLLKDN